jgi:hypothetical protein
VNGQYRAAVDMAAIEPEPLDLDTDEGKLAAVGGAPGDSNPVDPPDAFRDAEERLFVYLPKFERHVRHVLRVPTTTRDLSSRLARLGFEPVQVEGPRHERGQRVRKRRYWRSPPGFDPGEAS